MEDINDKKVKLADFNESVFQLQRLHNIWTKCNYFLVMGDYYRWNFNLDCAWIELYPDSIDLDESCKEDDAKFINQIEKLDKEIYNNWQNKNLLFRLMKKKHMILKLLQEKTGKGSKKSFHFEDIM